MKDDLLSLLEALNGVQQSPRYHPEGDALYGDTSMLGDEGDEDIDDEGGSFAPRPR